MSNNQTKTKPSERFLYLLETKKIKTGTVESKEDRYQREKESDAYIANLRAQYNNTGTLRF